MVEEDGEDGAHVEVGGVVEGRHVSPPAVFSIRILGLFSKIEYIW